MVVSSWLKPSTVWPKIWNLEDLTDLVESNFLPSTTKSGLTDRSQLGAKYTPNHFKQKRKAIKLKHKQEVFNVIIITT